MSQFGLVAIIMYDTQQNNKESLNSLTTINENKNMFLRRVTSVTDPQTESTTEFAVLSVCLSVKKNQKSWMILKLKRRRK